MSLEQRIVDLESVIAHLQYDLEQLSSVVLEQRKLIEVQNQYQQKLESRLVELENPEQRDPEQERPPHY